MQKEGHVEVSVYQKAKKGNYYCGDSYFYHEADDKFICALADGLGSGEFAKESSQIVMDVIKENTSDSVASIMKKSNKKLVGKRGVVLGILQIDLRDKQYAYSSIGNIGLLTVTSDSIKKRNIPQAGYLSGFDRPFKIMSDDVEENMIFIMFSDGVTSKEISNSYFHNQEVEQITDTFSYQYKHNMDDDTTLIAMKYKEGPQ
ncbi:SpoIIE family protein phosphatase [Gracilibacillus caseinilyticus]|uniref:SpoIIE family protein phosphatase n=1 Tax=Gracilibacillus caseinilyticus TaxID=2932256 RepID=A0ABY4EXG5_9BACI|nr:SpoIIE family protein phosphatase [Gracilibacillus caseinilyticus]UOQ49105.1 SpoIIE family protein phosphatase [Gracilibacillus caseinilyticus]